MGINLRPNMDISLLAGRVPFENDIYVIGPFASRVNIASQQRRALGLVWAINDEFERSGRGGLDDKDVAVIGAGVAGLTASVALTTFGARSFIIEKGRQEFSTLLDAKHRYIHPSVNFWPQEPVDPSTFLPFMNWHYGRCDHVLEHLEAEWRELNDKSPLIKGVFAGHELESIARNGGGKLGLKLKSTKDAAPLNLTEFDAVILATGFGVENFVDGTPKVSYWDSDNDPVGHVLNGKASACSKHVISGAGDGGVIEVLRLLFGEFRAGGLDDQVASLMRENEVPKIIRSAERNAQKVISDTTLHGEFPIPQDVRDKVALDLWSEYLAIFNEHRQGHSFDQMMSEKKRANPNSVDSVTLLGEWASPVDFALAPYHKLLLTFAIQAGYVDYIQIDRSTKVSRSSTKRNPDDQITPSSVKINVIRNYSSTGRGVSVKGPFNPKKSSVISSAFFLSRHGYTSPLRSILKLEGAANPHASSDRVRFQQALYAEQDWLTFVQADDYAERLAKKVNRKVAKPGNAKSWFQAYRNYIEAYFEGRHGVKVSMQANSEATEGDHISVNNASLRLSYSPEETDGDEANRNRIAQLRDRPLPERFLGFTVEQGISDPPIITSPTGHA